MSEKHVRLNEENHWTIDLPCPDVIRKRRVVPNVKTANEISIRPRAAGVDGTWTELRRKLNTGWNQRRNRIE
jgi:hypothetical protein